MTNFNGRAIPRAAALNDLSCHGKCSLTVAIPLLSACGVEAVPLPTALLSTHTGGFSGYTKLDLTSETEKIISHYESLKIGFDGIYTGYFCSPGQIDLAIRFIRNFGNNALTVIDPVMGDGGRLYSGFPENFPEQMRRLIPFASVVTPNVTEAFLLCGQSYSPVQSRGEISSLLDSLTEMGAESAVITGICDDRGKIGYAFKTAQGEREDIYFERYDGMIHGCGDVFASVLTGRMLTGSDLYSAVREAADFTRICIEKTIPVMEEHPYGLLFETSIGRLSRGGKSSDL